MMYSISGDISSDETPIWDPKTNVFKDSVKLFRRHSYYKLLDKETFVNIGTHFKKNKQNTLKGGQKVFFSKSAHFSRLKFRQWAHKNNISITRKIEYADVVIIDPSGYNEIIQNRSATKYYLGGFDMEYGIYTVEESIQDEFLNLETGWLCNNSITEASLDELTQLELITKHQCGIMYVKTLRDIIFTQVLDQDAFDSISNMLNSENDDDKELGVEFLSNYNWEDSAFLITKLFHKYYNVIEHSSTYSSVTFAHIRPIFEDYNTNAASTEFMNIFQFLAKRNLHGSIGKTATKEAIIEMLSSALIPVEKCIEQVLNISMDKIEISYDNIDGTKNTFWFKQ